MGLTIDTTDATYQTNLNRLENLRSFTISRVQVLRKFPIEKQKQWLQNDPLLRKLIVFCNDVADWVPRGDFVNHG